MSLQWWQKVRVQEVSMRKKEPWERQAVSRKEEECSGTAWADERANDGVGGSKQTAVRGEHNSKRAVEPAEMHPWIEVDPNEHNWANEQDFARQLSRLNLDGSVFD